MGYIIYSCEVRIRKGWWWCGRKRRDTHRSSSGARGRLMRARGMSSGVGHKEERDDKMGGKPVSPDVLPCQPLPDWVKSTRTLLLCRARILPQQAALSAQSRRSPVRGFGDPFRAATLHRLDLCGIASTAPASASTSVIRNVDLTPMSFSPIASLSFDHQRRPDLACQLGLGAFKKASPRPSRRRRRHITKWPAQPGDECRPDCFYPD